MRGGRGGIRRTRGRRGGGEAKKGLRGGGRACRMKDERCGRRGADAGRGTSMEIDMSEILLQALPYAEDALEPAISRRTVEGPASSMP